MKVKELIEKLQECDPEAILSVSALSRVGWKMLEWNPIIEEEDFQKETHRRWITELYGNKIVRLL